MKFQQILAEVRRAEASRRISRGEDSELASFTSNLHANAIFSANDNQNLAAGGPSRWDAALAWIEEHEEPSALPEPQRPAGESAEEIFDELGITDKLTFEELNQRRRLYMWRNHPDRHSEALRESATRRVAIANMLVDRAQSRLTGSRRP